MERMSKKEISTILSKKGIIGLLWKVVALNHHTIDKANVTVYSQKYHKMISNQAKCVRIGILVDIKPDYITITSNWDEFQENVYLGEIHKILRNDIINIEELTAKEPIIYN